MGDPLADLEGLSAERKAEFIKVYNQLAFMDSIHDFWPERKRVGGQDADEDEDEVLDEGRMDQAREGLVEVIRGYTGRPEPTINEILGAVTNDNVTSATSNFEPNVEQYLKTISSTLAQPTARISFDEILTNAPWTNTSAENWPTYQAAIQNLPDGLELYPGETKRLKTLTPGQRNQIGFFVLAYLYPNEQPGTPGAGRPEFTFDAAPKDVEYLFGDLNQTLNALFPQNIADSASTSFSALRGRALYSPAGPIPYRSNVYSRNAYQLSIANSEGFGPKNRFGFALRVQRIADGQTADAPFGIRATQGPSVNYLIDLLTTPATAQPPGKVLDLSPWGDLIRDGDTLNKELLYDLKRTGDSEQVFRAASAFYSEQRPITMVTIDRLCSVMSRALGVPTIFHSSKGFYMHRARGAGLSPQGNILRTAVFRANELSGKVELLNQLRANTGGIRDQLTRMRDYLRDTAERGATVFSDPAPVPGSDAGLDWTDNMNGYAGTFAAAILRYRLRNIRLYIERMLTEIDPLLEGVTQEDVDALTALLNGTVGEAGVNVDTGDITVGEVNYTAALNRVEALLKNTQALSQMGIVRDATAAGGTLTYTPEPLYVEFLEANGRLKRSVKSTFYKFSAAPFGELQVVVGKLLRENRGRINEKSITTSLVEYFRARDAIKEDFFDIDENDAQGNTRNMKETIEAWTDITTGLTPAQSIGAAPAEGQTLLRSIRGTVGEMGVVPTAGGATTGGAQVGGAGDPLQWIDLNDLLFEISDTAYGMIYSGLTEAGADNVGALTGAIDEVYRPLLDELESKWVQTIADLRARGRIEYSGPFAESFTTDALTYILSFRTTPDGIQFLPRYSDTTTLADLPPDVYGTLTRRNQVELNDIYERMVSGDLPSELKTLVALTRIREAYPESGARPFAAADQWDSLGKAGGIRNALDGIVPSVMARKAAPGYRTGPFVPRQSPKTLAVPKQTLRAPRFGGGLQTRRALYSNDVAPQRTSARRGLYERLQQRSGPRRTARVRQPARKSRTRRHRKHLDRV